jgi:hypothetical protein
MYCETFSEYRKPKWPSRMNNSETHRTLGKQETGQHKHTTRETEDQHLNCVQINVLYVPVYISI